MSGFYQRREGYKKPDVKAPRFRKPRLNVLTLQLYKDFCKEHPELKVDYNSFRKIILCFNRSLRRTVEQERDGVELPCQLGLLFLGSCPRKKEDNPDVLLSREHDQKIQHKNWDSNQYICKIFYSSYGTKYRLTGRRYWYFKPCRNFTRSASQTYRKQWNKYIKVSPIQKIAALYQEGVRSIKVQKHDYNSGRRIDFSDTQSN